MDVNNLEHATPENMDSFINNISEKLSVNFTDKLREKLKTLITEPEELSDSNFEKKNVFSSINYISENTSENSEEASKDIEDNFNKGVEKACRNTQIQNNLNKFL